MPDAADFRDAEVKDHHDIDERDLLPFDKILGRHGPVEYLLGFNKAGEAMLFTRKGRPVKDVEEHDPVWLDSSERLASESLQRGSTTDDKYICVKVARDEHRVMSTARNPGGRKCALHIIALPE